MRSQLRANCLGQSPSQECVSLSIVPVAQGKAGQGSCHGSLQSLVNFSGLEALNQIFKSNSKINIKVEWLWNPLDSFVICFRWLFWTWPWTTFNSIPIILKLATNGNVALVYSVTICCQKSGLSTARLGSFQHKLQHRFFNFDVCAAFITSLLY